MERLIRKIWTPALLLVLFLAQTTAQEATVRTPGYWTIGLNAGAAYQQSDVCALLEGYGGGLTLAKNFYYQPGAPIAFDLRGRALYTRTYGQDHFRTYGINNNNAINGNKGTDYRTEGNGPGFAYLNNKTDMGELALEGVISFNRLRERTGVNLALFGGIGLDWYNTSTNQSNGSGIYNYASIDTTASRSSILSSLDALQDGNYETAAQGSNNGDGKIGIMPALGVELGYQFTPRFSAGITHKVTFARTDDLDGQQWQQYSDAASAENDIHHYTSLSLKWIVSPDKKKLQPPFIEVIDPNGNPYTTAFSDGSIRANVKNVNSAADISVKVNGKQTNFDFYREKLTANFNLRPGKNSVRIRATNAAGSDEESLVIIYEPDTRPPTTTNPPPPPVTNQQVYKPTVRITSPSRNSQEVSNSQFTLKATTKYVRSQRDIQITLNNQQVRDFNFDESRGKVAANLYLNPGKNNIRISVSNQDGNARDEAILVYVQTQQQASPIVNITTPNRDPYTSSKRTTTVKATVKNVSRKNDISVKVNGRNSDFSFSGTTVSTNLTLDNGNNRVLITAKNNAGQNSDEVTIKYSTSTTTPPSSTNAKPKVTITDPTGGSSTSSKKSKTIKATVLNVTSKNEIKFTFNGKNITDFSFDKNSKKVSKTISLDTGNNTITIKATNKYGSDQATAKIRYLSMGSGSTQKKPPVVTITSPKNNSSTSSASSTVKATIKNVTNKQGVTLKVNGKTISNFSFSNTNLQASISLKEGSNTIYVKGKNSDGEDDATVKVNYKKPVTTKPPSVTITSPKKNTTVQTSKATIKATITNIKTKSGITFTANGKTSTNFTYSNGKFSSNVNLKEGKNTYKIRVKNEAGSDDASTTITYTKKQAPKPIVSFTKPSKSGTTSTKKNITITATVKNVTSKNDITLMLNGKPNTFTFSPNKNQVTANVKLKNNNNTLVIKAKNSAGEGSATTSIKYKAETKTPPTVKILTVSQPASNPMNPNSAGSTMTAKVENVTGKSQITITINGKPHTNFTYNASTKTLNTNLILERGSNKVIVKATNSDGTAQDSKTITF